MISGNKILVRFTSTVLRMVFLISYFFAERGGNSRGFLIPGYTGLGNFIMKTPFIRELRNQFPYSKIDVLCGNSFGTEYVLEGSSIIDEILVLPIESSLWKKIQFYWTLRGKYDTIFFFFDTQNFHLYWGSILAAIPNRIGHINPKSTFYSSKFALLSQEIPLRFNTHEMDLNFDLLEPLTSFNRSYEQLLSVNPKLSKSLLAKMSMPLKKGQYIILQLSSANGNPTPKSWPPKHFNKLIKLLLDQGIHLIAVGDYGEREIAELIIYPYENKLENLVGRTTIQEIVSLINSAGLLVCHDSGLMHIANALNVALLAIWGPGDYEKSKPLGVNSHVIHSKKPCSPCLGINGKWSEAEALLKCPHRFFCMSDITPENVFDKIMQLYIR